MSNVTKIFQFSGGTGRGFISLPASLFTTGDKLIWTIDMATGQTYNGYFAETTFIDNTIIQLQDSDLSEKLFTVLVGPKI